MKVNDYENARRVYEKLFWRLFEQAETATGVDLVKFVDVIVRLDALIAPRRTPWTGQVRDEDA